MANIYLIDVDEMDVYRNYFDITIIPATVFFFNSEHIRIDWGQVTADKNKFNYFFIILLFLELLITLNLLVRSEKNKILLML